MSADEIRPGLRSIRVQQHVVYYRLGHDTVTVRRVLHGRMDAAQHVEEH